MLKTPQNEVEILRKKLAIRDAEIALNRTNHLNETRLFKRRVNNSKNLNDNVISPNNSFRFPNNSFRFPNNSAK